MDKNVKLSTDERFQKATSEQPVIPEKFTDLKEEKLWLRQEIERQFPSVNQFAQHCYMSHSHLYDFFNKTKRISYDKMIIICIVLGYDTEQIKSMLERFQLGTLYMENERICIIIQALHEADLQGLKQRQRLDYVESRLLDRNIQTLVKNKSSKI